MTEDKRTEFAMAAVDFSGLFNSYFSDKSFGGYKVELTAPEGQSTGGGVQARQHITLVSPADGHTVVVGACNNFEKTAELRTYDHVSARFSQRHSGAAFPVDSGEFSVLRQNLTDFFNSQSFTLSTTAAPAAATRAPAAQAGKSSSGLIIFVVVLLLLVAAGLVYYFGFYNKP